MSISPLSKEQKQYMVLGALVGGIALYSLFTFVLGPMKKNWSEASLEVETLQAKVDDAERLIDSRAKLVANLKESEATMNAATGTFMPDPANPLAWATRTLYAVARDLGLDIQAVSELGASSILTQQSESGDRMFDVYAVRVEAACGYDMLKQFLRALEQTNPYVCVSGITVQRNLNQPEQHGINLTLEWPAWTQATPRSTPPGGKGV